MTEPIALATLVQDTMQKVERIKALKGELGELVASVEAGRQALIEHGIVMDFPILRDLAVGSPPSPNSAAPMIATAIVPPGPEPVMEAEEPSAAGAALDHRPVGVIRSEAFISPDHNEVEAFKTSLESSLDAAIRVGYEVAEHMAAQNVVGPRFLD